MKFWPFIQELPKEFDATASVKVCNMKGQLFDVDCIEIDKDGSLIIHFDDSARF